VPQGIGRAAARRREVLGVLRCSIGPRNRAFRCRRWSCWLFASQRPIALACSVPPAAPPSLEGEGDVAEVCGAREGARVVEASGARQGRRARRSDAAARVIDEKGPQLRAFFVSLERNLFGQPTALSVFAEGVLVASSPRRSCRRLTKHVASTSFSSFPRRRSLTTSRDLRTFGASLETQLAALADDTLDGIGRQIFPRSFTFYSTSAKAEAPERPGRDAGPRRLP